MQFFPLCLQLRLRQEHLLNKITCRVNQPTIARTSDAISYNFRFMARSINAKTGKSVQQNGAETNISVNFLFPLRQPFGHGRLHL